MEENVELRANESEGSSSKKSHRLPREKRIILNVLENYRKLSTD